MITDPFGWIAPHCRRGVFGALTLLMALSTAWLYWIGQSLITPDASLGIVSLEFARTAESTEAVMSSWSEGALSLALLIQGFDFLYLLVYPAWFALAACLIGDALGGRWQTAGVLLGWIVLLAAPLDGAENYALIRQLLYGADAGLAALAFWCGLPKFALVIAASAYLVGANIAWLSRRSSTLRS